MNYTIPQELPKEINRITRENVYEPNVFFINNLGYIEKTAARKINFNDALNFEKLHKNIYQQFGYRLIHIPAIEIQKRTDIIINTLQSLVN